jgi:hypothetical protein
MKIEVIEVKSSRERIRFIRFPYKLYKSNINYVGELNMSIKNKISKKNPFLHHSEIALFIAVKDDQDVGRIAVIHNITHLEVYNDSSGFFGYFDSFDDIEVAKALFDVASDWLSKKGIKSMIGPTNLTTNDSCGILIKGFEYPNMISMPYNFEYYDQLMTHCGFQKEVDLYAYKIDGRLIKKKYGNILERSLQAMKNNGIVIRPISSKTFKHDLNRLKKAYNECNINNWGFMPLNEKEFYEMAKELKMIAPLDLALILEKDEEIIGFVMAAPDINQAIKYVYKGKLTLVGILKLLWYKRKINKGRVMILGVLEAHKGRGLDLVLCHKITQALYNLKIYEADASYVLENNNSMNSVLKKIGGNCIKEYRIYKKRIA